MAERRYLLGERAAADISGLLRKLRNSPDAHQGIDTTQRRNTNEGQILCGKLDGTMARGGSATMNIFRPGTQGGIGTDVGETVSVADIGQIPAAASPLPADTTVMAQWSRGMWILSSFDCDAV